MYTCIFFFYQKLFYTHPFLIFLILIRLSFFFGFLLEFVFSDEYGRGNFFTVKKMEKKWIN